MSDLRVAGDAVIPAGTVTFLLADVEGSTQLWEAGAEAMSASIDRLGELTDAIVELNGGARPVEQGEGDSFVAGFSRASDAVACALELQRALANEKWPGPELKIRIGLHTGEARLRDDGRNYAGEAMNRTARLRNLGHGGQTLLSRSTYELVVDSLPEDGSLRDLGPHRLRDLQRPEHVWQLCHAELADEFPALRSLEAMANNLPAHLTSFVGRVAEIAEVRRLLVQSRIVTLTGSGGCGKTRLAVQTGVEALEEFPQGVWLVDLGPVNDPDLVARTAAAAMSIREEPFRSMRETLKADLHDRRLLIVLDNCEHLIAACADLVDELLMACPHVTILATSRESLGVEGEISWRVPSLEFPQGDEQVGTQEAVLLFCDRAVQARPNFRLTEDNTQAIADVCRCLEGIPLAIELAAARVRVMTPAQIASGLNDRFHLLTGGARRAMPRQRTLEASVDWSYDLLRDEEKALLRRLSVFAGGFTLDAAEAVCAGDGIESQAVLDVLTSLVDKSLVQVEDESDEARYRLLETIRLYARQRLVDAGEGPAVGARHLDFFVAFAEEAGSDPELGRPGWLARIESEMDNLRAALDWSAESDETDKGIRLVTPIQSFWDVGGHAREVAARLTELLSAGGGDIVVRIRGLLAAGQLSFFGFDSAAGVRFATEARELAREVGDRRSEALALSGLGWHQAIGQFAGGREAFEGTLELAQEIGDDTCLFYGHLGMGFLLLSEGRPAEGRVHLDHALSLSEPANIGPIARGFVLAWLGFAVVNAGDVARGQAMLDEAVAILRQVRFTPFLVQTLVFRSNTSLFTGDYVRARELLAEARREAHDLDPFGFTSEGLLLLCEGKYEQAAAELDRSSRAAEAFGTNLFAGQFRAFTAEAWIALGRIDDARKAVNEAAAIASDPAIPWALVIVRPAQGRLGRVDSDLDLADRRYRETLALGVESGLGLVLPWGLEGLAGVAAYTASYGEAARLFGAAAKLRDDMGFVRFAYEVERYEADVACTREALGPQAFEEAWAQGGAMTMQEAVAYASRAHGPRKRPSSGWESLTPAESDVVRLVAEGMSNKEIAEKLFVSPRTVQTHLTHVYSKLGISSRVQLVQEALTR